MWAQEVGTLTLTLRRHITITLTLEAVAGVAGMLLSCQACCHLLLRTPTL